MREIEVLAPAGSFDTMKAAYKAGADAVYMGGPMFGARAYADNADAGQMLSAIDYAHLHGRKLYMTVNTLLKNTEIEGQLEDYIRPFYEQGLDAVIVQVGRYGNDPYTFSGYGDTCQYTDDSVRNGLRQMAQRSWRIKNCYTP